MSVRNHPDVKNDLSEQRIKEIASGLAGDFLKYPQVCTPEFFNLLDAELRERGLMFSLEQRGIHGTIVSIVEV